MTALQLGVPFPSTASSQGSFSLPDPPLQPTEESAAVNLVHHFAGADALLSAEKLKQARQEMPGRTWSRAAVQKETRKRGMPPISPPPHESTPPLPH
ncbi:hypothetical protein HPB50_026997 [Hyalomma asiaticum]|uniref:Uncharacterized protein n=1 Tax=Hyalomma asiaticum TaxID=266040 RepID=A0ACB7STS8_HYAAI|nr:hypothetical protein HPB50_026997 [Hyalomma asiaticum]